MEFLGLIVLFDFYSAANNPKLHVNTLSILLAL